MALSKAQKSLKKWTSQDWGYVTTGDKKKPKKARGRYLPASVRKSKKAASKKGKKRAKYSKAIAKKVRSA
jgi:hypothetical protein